MFPTTTRQATYASSDVPPYYSPTDLISPNSSTVPPSYTETAAAATTTTTTTTTTAIQEEGTTAATTTTTTIDPVTIAPPNVTTPKLRRRRRSSRRRENCPLSSHPWVLWLLWLYCSALFAVEIVELKHWNSWPIDSERSRIRRQFKWALAFTYVNTILTGLAVGLYLPLMLWNHYFFHYYPYPPGKYEIPPIFVDNFFAAYFLGFAPLRVETYLWFSIPLILLFAYSGFLRGLRYKKNREGTTLRDPPANVAQMSGIIGPRNSSTAGENAGRNTEYQ